MDTKRHPFLYASLGVLMVVLLLTASLSACSLDAPECEEMPAPFEVGYEMSEFNLGYFSTERGETEGPIYLKWGYPVSDCMPDRFRIIVNDVPVMEEESLFEEVVSPLV